MRALIESVRVVPFEIDDARTTGRIRAALRRRGRTIAPFDVLLAGCAVSRGLVMVTANAAELSRIEGLTVESWR